MFNESINTDLKSPPGTRGAGSSPALAIQTNITGVVKYGTCDYFLAIFIMLLLSYSIKFPPEVPKRCPLPDYVLRR